MASPTVFVCRFIRENGEQYSAVTTVTINRSDVKAINSPKVATVRILENF